MAQLVLRTDRFAIRFFHLQHCVALNLFEARVVGPKSIRVGR